jgi:ankyrin repeat protein
MNNFTNYDLVQACMSGNLELAKSLLEQKPTIDICDEKAFVEACRYGHLELAKWLLEQKTTIDISANNDEAFVSACSNGSLEVAKWLLKIKPTIDISVEKAFRSACAFGYLEVAKWLLKIKPTIDIYACYKYCCELSYKFTCNSRKLEVLKWLRILYTVKTIKINTEEIAKKNTVKVTKKKIFEYPILNIYSVNPTLNTSAVDSQSFRYACITDYLEVVEWLQNINSADINVSDNELFIYVCETGSLELAKWLIEEYPNIDISSENDKAFRKACGEGYLELAKWLLEVKPTIDISAENDDAFRSACQIDFHKKLLHNNNRYNRYQNGNQYAKLESEKRLLEFKVTTNMSDEDYEEFRMSCKPDKKLLLRDYELDKS